MELRAEAIESVDDALNSFGEDPSLIVAYPGRSCWKCWFTVPSGFYALVSEWGKITETVDERGNTTVIHPEGYHQACCWTGVSHLITKQAVVFDAPCRGVPTRDNVVINLDVAITFHVSDDPEMIRVFAQEVKPSDLKVRLLSAVDQSVKSIARSIDHTQAYGLRSLDDGEVGSETMQRDGGRDDDDDGGVNNNDNNNTSSSYEFITHNPIHPGVSESKGDDDNDESVTVGSYNACDITAAKRAQAKGTGVADSMREELAAQFKSSGIEILSVTIKNVTYDNRDIQNQLQARTMAISKRDEQKMDQTRSVLEISNNEALETLKQKLHEDQERVKQEGEKQRNDVNVRMDKLRTDHFRSLEAMRKKREVAVAEIYAAMELEQMKSSQEVSAIVEEAKATANADAQRNRSETSLIIEKSLAEADLEVAKNRSLASIALSDAEGTVAPMLVAKNKFETEKRRLQVYRQLADNPDVIIASSDDNDVNTLIVADKILERTSGSPASRQSILAEMMVQSKSTKSMMMQG